MPWDPMRDLLTMQERLESLFGHAAPGWIPPVDLAEFEDRYVLTAELPGLEEKDFEVSLSGDALVLKGEKQEECEDRTRGAALGRAAPGLLRLAEDLRLAEHHRVERARHVLRVAHRLAIYRII